MVSCEPHPHTDSRSFVRCQPRQTFTHNLASQSTMSSFRSQQKTVLQPSGSRGIYFLSRQRSENFHCLLVFALDVSLVKKAEREVHFSTLAGLARHRSLPGRGGSVCECDGVCTGSIEVSWLRER